MQSGRATAALWTLALLGVFLNRVAIIIIIFVIELCGLVMHLGY